MENDESSFAAGAGIDVAVSRNVRSTTEHSGFVPSNMKRRSSSRTRASQSSEAHEDTPLLADERRESHASSQAGGDGSGLFEDWDNLPWYKRPSIKWILFPFAMFAMSYGGTIVPKLNLILDMVCRAYLAERAVEDPNFTALPVIFGKENDQCHTPPVQSRVADFTLYGSLISGLLSALVSPRLGMLSDAYGRKVIIIVSLCGAVCGEIFATIATTYIETFPHYVFLVSYAMDGLCGSFTTAMAISHSYAADCTSPKQRGVVFGYFHACLFTGIALGPLIAAWIIKVTRNLASVFLAATVVQLCVLCFIAVVVPESLTSARQMAAREKQRIEGIGTAYFGPFARKNPFAPLKILYPTGEGSSRAVRQNLIVLAAIDTIVFGVAMGTATVVIYYIGYQFGWETYESNIYLFIVSLCRIFALLIVLPILNRFVRGSSPMESQKSSGSDMFDLTTIRIAIFLDTIGYIGFSLARTGTAFTIAAAFSAFGGIASPTLQSSLTKHVPAERTGQVLGATALLHALARVVGPTIFNGIYRSTVGKFSQAVFVCLAGTFFLTFISSWFLRPHVYFEEPRAPNMDNQPSEALNEEVGRL